MFQTYVSGSRDVLLKKHYIVKTGYLMKVCLCADFQALKDAHSKRCAKNSVYDWLTEESFKNDLIHYWKMNVDFQSYILLSIRSQRDIFAFNHHHYARWLSVHVDDLLYLQHT